MRWTGEGHAIAKVVPIKGAIVKRKKISDVPTGYIDDDETRQSVVAEDDRVITDPPPQSGEKYSHRQDYSRRDRHRSGRKRHSEG